VASVNKATLRKTATVVIKMVIKVATVVNKAVTVATANEMAVTVSLDSSTASIRHMVKRDIVEPRTSHMDSNNTDRAILGNLTAMELPVKGRKVNVASEGR